MFLDIETAVRNRDGVFGDKKQPSEIGTVFLEIKNSRPKSGRLFGFIMSLVSVVRRNDRFAVVLSEYRFPADSVDYIGCN